MGPVAAFRRRIQDEAGSFRHPDLRQDGGFVAERRVDFEKTRILGYGRIQPVTPISVGHVNFRPRRRQKHAPMVPVGLTKRRQHRLAGQVLKAGSGVDQAPVEEHPAV